MDTVVTDLEMTLPYGVYDDYVTVYDQNTGNNRPDYQQEHL